jgi:hypothetical protein
MKRLTRFSSAQSIGEFHPASVYPHISKEEPLEENRIAPTELNLSTICGGAADEVFRRELQEVLANIADVNTPAEAKRSITLKFIFSPLKDRGASQVQLECNSKIASVEKTDGTIFISRTASGAVRGVPYDPSQGKLFSEAPPPGVAEIKPRVANGE